MLYALIKQARKLANDLSNDGAGREIRRAKAQWRSMALESDVEITGVESNHLPARGFALF